MQLQAEKTESHQIRAKTERLIFQLKQLCDSVLTRATVIELTDLVTFFLFAYALVQLFLVLYKLLFDLKMSSEILIITFVIVYSVIS